MRTFWHAWVADSPGSDLHFRALRAAPIKMLTAQHSWRDPAAQGLIGEDLGPAAKTRPIWTFLPARSTDSGRIRLAWRHFGHYFYGTDQFRRDFGELSMLSANFGPCARVGEFCMKGVLDGLSTPAIDSGAIQHYIGPPPPKRLAGTAQSVGHTSKILAGSTKFRPVFTQFGLSLNSSGLVSTNFGQISTELLWVRPSLGEFRALWAAATTVGRASDLGEGLRWQMQLCLPFPHSCREVASPPVLRATRNSHRSFTHELHKSCTQVAGQLLNSCPAAELILAKLWPFLAEGRPSSATVFRRDGPRVCQCRPTSHQHRLTMACCWPSFVKIWADLASIGKT